MKSLALCTILASGLALAACGGDDEAGDDDGASPDASSGPAVTATAANTSVIAGEAVNLTISTENFTLEAPAGQANADGHGHYHVYLDVATGGDYLAADAAGTVAATIPADTTAGAHTLKVQLFENDHSAVTPEVSDTVDITVAVSTAATVSATVDNDTPAAGDTVTLTISTENFTLEAPTGQANQAGHGHYHVYFDANTGGDYLAADAAATVDVDIPDAAGAGAHTLRVQLFNNDHTAVTPTVEDIVNLTIP